MALTLRPYKVFETVPPVRALLLEHFEHYCSKPSYKAMRAIRITACEPLAYGDTSC